MYRFMRALRWGLCTTMAGTAVLAQAPDEPLRREERVIIRKEAADQAREHADAMREQAERMREDAERVQREVQVEVRRRRDAVEAERKKAEDQYDHLRHQYDVLIRPGGGPRAFIRALPSAAQVAEVPLGKAWLGVQLCPVPAALVEHLRLEDRGVMVCNVFVDSPAEKAGLERYDIIVRTDGEPTPGGHESVAKFAERVRDKNPGERIELIIVHRGQEKSIAVGLVKPPKDPAQLKPKYEEDPDVAISREFGLRGKILRPGPGPDGWVMEDLGAFPELVKPLERGMGLWLEKPGPDGRPGKAAGVLEARRVDKDGRSLQVRRDEAGRITVKRSRSDSDDSEVKVQVFDNMEELRKSDREAFELIESAAPGARVRIESVRPPVSPDAAPRKPVVPPTPRPPAAGPAERSPEDNWREWERGFFRGPLRDPREPAGEPLAPRTRFEVSPEGQITVHTRDGDAELSKTFRSREEFREKAPRLFERFERMEDQMGR